MNIAILSRSEYLYSTNSLRVAGESRGHNMTVIDHTRCHIMATQDKLQVFFEGELIEHLDAIIPRIGASVTAHGAAILRQFELKEVVTSTHSDALLEARDKFRSLQRLAVNAIPIPLSFLIGSNDDLTPLFKILRFPLIIKLLESTHGNGVILANNRQTTSSIIDAFTSTKERILLQEFISEASGQDIRVFVVGDEVVAAMLRKAEKGEFRSNLHRGATGYAVKLSTQEKEMALAATKTLGLDVAGVDLLRSKKGPLVIEVNASPGLEGIETVTGVDIAGKIIDFIEHKVARVRL